VQALLGEAVSATTVSRVSATLSREVAVFQQRALADRYVDMRMLPPDDIDERAALSRLPPVIKGYLRLGGFVGDGAVVDAQFNTTDVCVVVKTDWLTSRYYRHYTRDDAPGAPVNG